MITNFKLYESKYECSFDFEYWIKRNDIKSLHSFFLSFIRTESKSKQLLCLKKYLSLDLDVNFHSERETTLLISLISSHSDIEIIKFVIENGADINLQGISNYTPLIIAVSNDYDEVTDLLLSFSNINLTLKSSFRRDVIEYDGRNYIKQNHTVQYKKYQREKKAKKFKI